MKFADIFETAFLQEHAHVSSFLQHNKPITREQNVIDQAVFSFMAVMLWVANVRHQTCKSESVKT